jgi:hypothetical protein
MRNYEVLRGGHPPRDIYAELQRIEQRGERLKNNRKARTNWLFGTKTKKVEGAAVSSL